MRPLPLPPDFDRPFHVRDADVLGIPRRRLLAGDLSAPFHGVRRRDDGTGIETISDLCEAFLPRMVGDQFFSHVTSATLWGMPLPFAPRVPLHVSAIPPAREPRARGIQGHRLAMPTDGITLLGGLPLATRAETWGQLAPVLRIEDLVAAGDWCLSHGDSWTDLEAVALRERRRGAVLLREAVGLVRQGSESPRESIVRMILVRAGLPEPELNWTLRTAAGVFVARLDMAYPKQRVAVEYDGRHHADSSQFLQDADRWRAISAEGWTLVRVVAHHLATPERDVIAPVRRALRDASLR
ncbi:MULTISPECIES: endonuclease domain-containing protein [Microbacterium]|uniref:endonuclease domain-containing protein n=1 Tax=Microbacterium TaxID=33882 RepID=UPI00277FB8C7|nr:MULTISPECIES: DUF559 domain-containing protein [Microbacterium]MDQ1085050.1 hypothetical protein [Microbacterium sp. SORGH_AS_0344]MDQ1169673.1 hypothetical protein [Microbacterium proteolyticum]